MTFNMGLDMYTGCLLCIIVILVLWLLTRRPSGLPPGPPLLPIVGNLLSMDTDPRVMFAKLRRKYGDIFCVYMFHKPVIVLNGYNVIRDALVKNSDAFSDRPNNYSTQLYSKGGVANTSGDTWRELHRFALRTLRDLGMGKSVIENKIQEELTEFLKTLQEELGQPIDCSQVLQNAVSNIICSVAFGKRFAYTDPLFRRCLDGLQENFANFGGAGLLNILPALRYLPGDPFKHKMYMRNRDRIFNGLIKPSIEKHMKQEDNSSDDFISAYIQEMKHRQQQGDTTAMNNQNLIITISDLFHAGTETSSTTIRWTLLYFLNYPDVQEKCFQEIKENIGQNRSPSMKDKTCLTYLEATIMEVLRYADIAPNSVPHAVSHDVQFRGYTFPKGVTVITNLDSVLQDSDLWSDPENFRPDRFLDDKGKLKKMEEFIPFGLGRRVCLGESLARMELFLFLASMIQRFKFVTVSGTKPSMKGIMGFTHIPKPFKLRALRRD